MNIFKKMTDEELIFAKELMSQWCHANTCMYEYIGTHPSIVTDDKGTYSLKNVTDSAQFLAGISNILADQVLEEYMGIATSG